MKPPVALVPLVFLLMGCASPAPQRDWGPVITSVNDQLLNQGNLTRLGEIFTPNYVVHLTSGDLSGGPDVIKSFVEDLRKAFPDLHVEIQILATQGDKVAWLRTHHGTQKADYMGVPASGRAIVWREMVVTRFEAGKIAEEWGVSDLAERLRAQ